MKYLAWFHIWLTLVWFLWRQVKVDGLGNKIHWWDALSWATDFAYRGINEV